MPGAPAPTTGVFNFTDLPCPPTSVMVGLLRPCVSKCLTKNKGRSIIGTNLPLAIIVCNFKVHSSPSVTSISIDQLQKHEMTGRHCVILPEDKTANCQWKWPSASQACPTSSRSAKLPDSVSIEINNADQKSLTADVPKIIFPSKIERLGPYWRSCSGAQWFTGYDPPRTLAPASRMTPDTTADSIPSAASDPNIPKTSRQATASPHRDSAVPAATPRPEQPARTSSRAPTQTSTTIKHHADPHTASKRPWSGSPINAPPAIPWNTQNPDPDSAAIYHSVHKPDPIPSHGGNSEDGEQNTNPTLLGFPDPSAPSSPQPKSSEPRLRSSTVGALHHDSQIDGTVAGSPTAEPKQSSTLESQVLSTGSNDLPKQSHDIPRLRTSTMSQASSPQIPGKPFSSQIGMSLVTAGEPSFQTPYSIASIIISSILSAEIIVQSGTDPILSVAAPSAFNTQTKDPMESSIILSENGETVTLRQPAFTSIATPISFGSTALILETDTFPMESKNPDSSIFTPIGTDPVTILSHGIAVAGSTLRPDGPAITISGTEVSLFDSTALMIGSSTLSIPLPSPTQILAAAITGQTITVSSGEVLVDGMTLLPGKSQNPAGGTRVTTTALVTDSSAVAIPTSENGLPDTTIRDQTLTVVSGEIIVDGMTLHPENSERLPGSSSSSVSVDNRQGRATSDVTTMAPNSTSDGLRTQSSNFSSQPRPSSTQSANSTSTTPPSFKSSSGENKLASLNRIAVIVMVTIGKQFIS